MTTAAPQIPGASPTPRPTAADLGAALSRYLAATPPGTEEQGRISGMLDDIIAARTEAPADALALVVLANTLVLETLRMANDGGPEMEVLFMPLVTAIKLLGRATVGLEACSGMAAEGFIGVPAAQH